MRRRSFGLTIAAGAAVFLVILVIYLPAAWLSGALPANLRCGELGGSVWHGECLGLKYGEVALGDATWNLGIASAFTGRLVGDIDLHGAAFKVRSDVDASFRGSGVLRNVNAYLDLDPALISQLPQDKRGTVAVNLGQLEIVDGSPRTIQGTIELRDFRQVGARPFDLGSYQAAFDETSPPGGPLVGKLRDLGGPFGVEGKITLTPPRNYVVEGLITGRTVEAERLVRELTLGAPPDAAGRSAFSLEGSY